MSSALAKEIGEEIGERDDRVGDVVRRDQEDDVDEDPDPTWIHEPCGTIVEQESAMAWFCPECEQRTNRVEEIDPTTVENPQPGAVVADGGEPCH